MISNCYFLELRHINIGMRIFFTNSNTKLLQRLHSVFNKYLTAVKKCNFFRAYINNLPVQSSTYVGSTVYKEKIHFLFVVVLSKYRLLVVISRLQ